MDKRKVFKEFELFYGEKLPKGSHKERHCGTGEFVVYIFEDPIRIIVKGKLHAVLSQ